MIEHLIHEVKTQKEIQSFRPCQGSVLSYIPSWTSNGGNILGYLVFAGGPNLNEFNFVVLTKPSCSKSDQSSPPSSPLSSPSPPLSSPSPPPYSPSPSPPLSSCPPPSFLSYQEYINAQGIINLGYAEAFQCSGQIREVTVIKVQDKMMVGIRCNYQFIVFEGPTRELEMTLQKAYNLRPPPSIMTCPPVKLLKTLAVYSTSVMTSSMALSPFIFGEVVFVTESGGVYLWEEDYEVTTIQSPLETFDIPHYWQCVFGPHPRAIILAEHTGVSLINFIEDTPTYNMIINKDSQYLIDSGITCIARHPLNPFYLFVAIGELLLLYDTRQAAEPLLQIRHEHFKDVRFIDVICCPWQPCTLHVMLSTLKDGKSIVYGIKGGYTFNEQDPSPPHIGTSPHAVDSFTHLLNQINVTSSPINWRLSQSLAGACLIPMDATEQFCGLTISGIGDIFMQAWHYEERPITPSVVPHSPKELALWLEEVLTQNKILEQMYETNNASGTKITWNFDAIMNFVNSPLADQGLCPRCCVLLSNGGPLEDISLPELPPVPKSILNGTANVWECLCCHDNVTISKEVSKYHANDQVDNIDSIRILDQLLKPNGEGEPLFDYEEINRLWKLWDNNGSVKEEQQQIKTETLYEEEQQDEQPLSQSIKDENFTFSSQDYSSQSPSQPRKKAKLKRRVGF